MYVAMPYFVFMEAMVSWLINGENISYVWNPCCTPFTPFYSLVGKGEDGPCVPKLREELNDAIVYYMLFFVCCRTSNGPYRSIVSCMIFCEPMSLLKPLYRDCVGMS